MRKIWVYALLRKYAPDLASSFADNDKSALLLMALADSDQVSYFTARDSLSSDAVTSISLMNVLRVNLFDEIDEEAMIWSIVESDYYSHMLRSHYDD